LQGAGACRLAPCLDRCQILGGRLLCHRGRAALARRRAGALNAGSVRRDDRARRVRGFPGAGCPWAGGRGRGGVPGACGGGRHSTLIGAGRDAFLDRQDVPLTFLPCNRLGAHRSSGWSFLPARRPGTATGSGDVIAQAGSTRPRLTRPARVEPATGCLRRGPLPPWSLRSRTGLASRPAFSVQDPGPGVGAAPAGAAQPLGRRGGVPADQAPRQPRCAPARSRLGDVPAFGSSPRRSTLRPSAGVAHERPAGREPSPSLPPPPRRQREGPQSADSAVGSPGRATVSGQRARGPPTSQLASSAASSASRTPRFP